MTITVSPMPGEQVHGHWGRLMRLNSNVSVNQLFESGPIANNRPLAIRIGEVCGMRSEDYIRLHTLIPYARAVSRVDQMFPHGAAENDVATRRLAMLPPHRGWSVCVNCVDEDLKFWGFSYWRRDHQLPGVVSCAKHGVALLFARDRAVDPMRQTPSEVLQRFEGLPAAIETSACATSRSVREFQELQQILLDRDRPVSLVAMRQTLTFACRERGWYTSGAGHRGMLGTQVLHAFPRIWLEHAYPHAAIPDVELARRISASAHATRPLVTTLYLLSMITLFNTAIRAINALETAERAGSVATRTQRKFTLQDWQSPSVIDCYRSAFGSHGAVARQMNVDVVTARRWMQLCGLPEMPRGAIGAQLRSAFAAFANGASLAEACAINGIGQCELERALRTTAQPAANVLRPLQLDHDGRGVQRPAACGSIVKQPH